MTGGKKQPEPSGGPQADPFATLCPNIAAWVQHGWVEIGHDDYSRSFVRALDIGGMVWEGKASYPSLHEALQALDAGIALPDLKTRLDCKPRPCQSDPFSSDSLINMATPLFAAAGSKRFSPLPAAAPLRRPFRTLRPPGKGGITRH